MVIKEDLSMEEELRKTLAHIYSLETEFRNVRAYLIKMIRSYFANDKLVEECNDAVTDWLLGLDKEFSCDCSSLNEFGQCYWCGRSY